VIAIDTSSLIAYFHNNSGKDIDIVEWAFEHKQAAFPPVVLSELLSDPKMPQEIKAILKFIPVLEIHERYWERVGLLRAQLFSKGLKARLADSLIAQSCLDHEISLLTRDRDFRHFRSLGLKLYL
jgi:hypothetical protein